jgi:hypothetical protein
MMPTKMHWLLGWKSELSTNNKILIFKAPLKPIRTYEVQLWDAAPPSSRDILECFQAKVLHMIVDTPWCFPNVVIRRDLQALTVKDEICHYSSQYNVCLSVHPNDLVVNLMAQSDNRQLRRHMPNDLPFRF